MIDINYQDIIEKNAGWNMERKREENLAARTAAILKREMRSNEQGQSSQAVGYCGCIGRLVPVSWT